MSPANVLLTALTQPEEVAAAADLAWARGDDRAAARLRVQLLRDLLALRDRLAIVVERANGQQHLALHTIEHALVEDLIAGREALWPVEARVRALLDAVVDLLRFEGALGVVEGGGR
jgi:hypothetical protein